LPQVHADPGCEQQIVAAIDEWQELSVFRTDALLLVEILERP
jgi:hypothetical protein